MTETGTATLKEFAELLGVRPSYVTKLKQAGRLVLTGDGRVDVEASKKRIAETADPNRDDVRARWEAYRGQGAQAPSQRPSESPETDRVAMTYQQARAVKERYLALQAKADYERLIGRLVEVEQVKLGATEVGTILRVTLENMADQLAQQLVAVPDYERIYALLVENFERLLADISGQLEAAIDNEVKRETRSHTH